MGRIRKRADPDRYLHLRQGNYYYKRRVPSALVGLDQRGTHVRISLKTDDLAQARQVRDLYEAADDELWSTMTVGGSEEGARARYQAAVSRARSLGFTYRPAGDISRESLETILQRIEAVMSPQTVMPLVRSVVGTAKVPVVTLREAFEIYCDEIVPHELAGKSSGQKVRWTNGKQLSVDTFVDLVGDLRMDEIDRDHARRYYQHWMERIAPREGAATHTASSGNRRVGDLRVLYRDYFRHIGEPDRRNPFEGMSFRERKKRRRPSFAVDWITSVIMAPGALSRLNDQARGVALVMIETGARPSEICNLTADMIVLDHPVPHLKIQPSEDPDEPREIKTQSSVRTVPLVGVALAVMKAHPSGFPRYRDKESAMSAALNKFFRENGLFPTPQHSMYSFRHTFEDRMKESRVDAELRRILMGHAIDRPEYGEGGSLKLRQKALKRMVLPFDGSIV